MRAVDHYREAEQTLEVAKDASDLDNSVLAAIAVAHVHATLALAGATALQAYSTGDENELADWEHAAGGAS
ncbi:hypothetical protein GCM10023403_10350 [Pseudonocardia benzenivorans]|uniref:hypothetical protein n=1 Tax=Pseudonocardia benzenivorans TaxID=228005 RepID=UPI0031F922CC